jgi:hypothetical protein
MGTLNERSAQAQIIWNSTASNSINPVMVGSLFYDINIQKLERDNSNAVYETADETYTKVAAINPTTKKWALVNMPTGGGGGSVQWGGITGDLENQTDLKEALDGKENVSNKQNNLTIDGTGTKYPTVDAVNSGLNAKVNGSGTTNYLPKFTATNTIGNSLIYDNGTNVGIGTPSPNVTDRVHVFNSTGKSSVRIQTTHATSQAEMNFQSSGGSGMFQLDQSGNFVFRTLQSSLYFDNFSDTGSIYFRTRGSNNRMQIDRDGNVYINKTTGSEKLDVNGNVKASLIKDQYGTLRSQRVVTVTGNITLSEVHNGAILHITNTCNITIPTGLGTDFSCDCYVKGAFIATFVNSGVTLNSPSGLLLKTDKMCTLYSDSANSLNLLGELVTS